MRKGFTLLELMVLIVIIGVLASIIVPKVTFTWSYSHKTSSEYNGN